MPDILTTKEKNFLQRLADSKSLLYDRVQISKLLDIIERQRKEIGAADFRYSTTVVASQGLATEEEILATLLPTDLGELAVDLRRQYDESQAWRRAKYWLANFAEQAKNHPLVLTPEMEQQMGELGLLAAQPTPSAPAPSLDERTMTSILDDPARAN